MTARGFTMVELMVVVGIVVLAIALGFSHFRSGNSMAAGTTASIQLHMEGRRIQALLHQIMAPGIEVIKPGEGSSATFTVFRDAVNQLVILFLEKPEKDRDGPWRLVSYTGDPSGAHLADNRRILATNIKEASFTTLGPGMSAIHLVLTNPAGKELSVLAQIPLKNLGSVDPE